MLGTIAQIDHEQLRLLLSRGWVRRIKSVHIHHTWRPNHAQWKGQSTVEAIRRYHVDDLNWSDIAQHLTIGPDGSLWTGRNLDSPPASVAGHNGTASEGPFMIEMAGDFDTGQDSFRDPQAASVYLAVAEVCAAFALARSAIRFHNEFTSAKSCPGPSLKLGDFQRAVEQQLAIVAKRKKPGEGARTYAAQIRIDPPSSGRALESAGAELPYDITQATRAAEDSSGARGLFTSFTPAEVEIFRSHVIDLARGQLSSGGCYQNTEADLDELIARLDRWVAQRSGKAARVMFFGHGGLVDEQAGLGIALRDYQWWLANDVYPIFFVWETGFLEVFQQEWQQREAGERAFITDPLLEWTLGPTIGEPTWSRIKDSALLASSDFTGTGKPGGAMVFLRKLAKWFATASPQAAKVEFHAVGHSAGAIFHCHFLPALEATFKSVAKAPQPVVASLALLAPAVRADLFQQMLAPRLGTSIGATSMFTMERRSELVDDVIKLYRKSLLYFVRNACEKPTHSTAILGLEESVRADPALVSLFGLGGSAGKAEVIWSPTPGTSGNAAAKAIHHGDFDNDSVTMNSVMRRILALADATPLPSTHLPQPEPHSPNASTSPERRFTPRSLRREAGGGRSTGQLSAVCIGINEYGTQSLNGCVADSQSFADALQQWGFQVQRLTDQRATRNGIMGALEALLAKSQAGDTVVIQYAGHGTQLPDLSGDESDGFDEAWVPYDYDHGEFVIDDDLGAMFDRHRDRGIQLIVFTDCCHSGTSTRMLLRAGAPQLASHSRFLQVPREIVDRFREKRAVGQSGARFGDKDSLGWEIHFAACQDKQSAYEHDGHGDFTQAVTRGLDNALHSPLSYQGLGELIANAFAGNSLQMPQLRALTQAGAGPLFGAPRAVAAGSAPAASVAASTQGDLAARIDQLTLAINALSKKIEDL